MASTGKIVRWNPDRGFGFVRLEDGREAFLHVTSVSPRQPRGVDLRGKEVEVHRVTKGPKGLRVASATLVETRPHVEIVLHYKERARIAGAFDPVRAMDDLVTGVGGTSEVEYGSGKLAPRVVRFFPNPMQPGERFVIRHWGEGKMKHDEYWVYDHNLVLVEKLDAEEVARRQRIGDRPSFEIRLHYKCSAEIAGENDLVRGDVGGVMETRSVGGRLEGTVATFILDRPLAPGERFVIRHWGTGGQRHDEYWVYDHRLERVKVMDVDELRRAAERAGRPYFELLLGYGVQLEAADPELAGLGIEGTLVPVEKIDWIESARAPVQRSRAEVTVSRPLAVGEFVALRQWKSGGDGFDEVTYYDHNLQEVKVVRWEDLEQAQADAALLANGDLESQLCNLRQQLAAKEAELKKLRRQAHGKPGFWARQNVDPVEEEVFDLQFEIHRLEGLAREGQGGKIK